MLEKICDVCGEEIISSLYYRCTGCGTIVCDDCYGLGVTDCPACDTELDVFDEDEIDEDF